MSTDPNHPGPITPKEFNALLWAAAKETTPKQYLRGSMYLAGLMAWSIGGAWLFIKMCDVFIWLSSQGPWAVPVVLFGIWLLGLAIVYWMRRRK